MSALRRKRWHPAPSGGLGECTRRTQRPGPIANADPRFLSKKIREFLLDRAGNILLDRYEWFLYQQIPDRLNGQLTLPEIIKYRALDADLIDGEHWRKHKYTLLKQGQLTPLGSWGFSVLKRHNPLQPPWLLASSGVLTSS